MNWALYFVLAAFAAIDGYLTYRQVALLKKYPFFLRKEKESTPESIELNAIMRFFWRKLGLKKGSIIMFVFTNIFFFAAIAFLGFSEFTIGFFFGAYCIVNIIHLANLEHFEQTLKKINWVRL